MARPDTEQQPLLEAFCLDFALASPLDLASGLRGVCSKIHGMPHYCSLSTRADNCNPAPRVRVPRVLGGFDSQAPPRFHCQTPLG